MSKSVIIKGRKPPANMTNVPPEELVLAEMISNAEEHDFRFQIGTTGVRLAAGSRSFEPDNEIKFMDPNTKEVVDRAYCGCAVGAHILCKAAPPGVDSQEIAFAMLSGLAQDVVEELEEAKQREGGVDDLFYRLSSAAGATERAFDSFGNKDTVWPVWGDVGRAYNAYHTEARYPDDPPNKWNPKDLVLA